jgi:hypothetical protein
LLVGIQLQKNWNENIKPNNKSTQFGRNKLKRGKL